MTDYEFPPMWGQMTDQQKHDWYVRERVFRQAIRQNTAFGRRYRATQEQEGSSDYRVDDELA